MALTLTPIWLEILSELFINLAAGWFALVFIEPQISVIKDFLPLIFKLLLGILSLVLAKLFREEARK